MSNDLTNGDEQRDNTDTELRELVYQSLERDGIITRLKAQLRAAVFKTIEKSANLTDDHPSQSIRSSRTEQICRALVLNWLEQSNLLYTQDIFRVETSNDSLMFTENDLVEEFHLENQPSNKSQSILHLLIDQHFQSDNSIKLSESIKQSIDAKFPMEKLSDFTRLREHFRSLFSSAFDPIILDTFLTKNLPSSPSISISKIDYEQICLKWIQSCFKVCQPLKQTSTIVPVQSSSNTQNGHIVTTRARRSFSPPSESNSSSTSTSTSQSENLRKTTPFDFPLPTTIERNHVQKLPVNGHKDLPIEYDDESASQSVDDVTVDKVSPSPSAQIDFFEDLE